MNADSGVPGGKARGRVRLARMQEIDRVAALWALITEHHADLDPLFRMRRGPVAEGELRELLRALQRDPDAAIFVYERSDPDGSDSGRSDSPRSGSHGSDSRAPASAPGDTARDGPGTPEGLCIVRIDHAPPILEETERGEITDLGVRPALRRLGIARQLVEAAQSWIRDRGVERVEIQVARGNREGQAFWRAMGYGELMDVLHKRL